MSRQFPFDHQVDRFQRGPALHSEVARIRILSGTQNAGCHESRILTATRRSVPPALSKIPSRYVFGGMAIYAVSGVVAASRQSAGLGAKSSRALENCGYSGLTLHLPVLCHCFATVLSR
jgi:hypothetical protein